MDVVVPSVLDEDTLMDMGISGCPVSWKGMSVRLSEVSQSPRDKYPIVFLIEDSQYSKCIYRNCTRETSIPGSKGTKQYEPLLMNESRTRNETYHLFLLYNTRFSPFAYTYHVMIHLNIRKLNL